MFAGEWIFGNLPTAWESADYVTAFAGAFQQAYDKEVRQTGHKSAFSHAEGLHAGYSGLEECEYCILYCTACTVQLTVYGSAFSKRVVMLVAICT